VPSPNEISRISTISPVTVSGCGSEPIVATMSTAQMIPCHQLTSSASDSAVAPPSVRTVSIAKSVTRRRRKCPISRRAVSALGGSDPVVLSLKWSNQRLGTPEA
jgi:hypothetical protein